MKIAAASCLSLVLLNLPAAAAAPAADPTPVPDSFGFSLVPNAFSKNPRMAMTIFTDMTEHGRTMTAASPQAPVYFVALDEGMRTEGEQIGGVISPPPAKLQEMLFRSLAGGGYLPAPEGTAPGLVLIYYWGSHYAMDLEQVGMFPEVHHRSVLERAMLVGGRAYRQQVWNEFAYGYTFADRTPKKTFLIDQASNDLYFVVVSAYDHAALVAGKRKLAWRTTMTASTNGISMQDALPPLVLTAGDYFGRETAEPVAVFRRVRRGTVTLGPLRVVADDMPKPRH